MRASMTARQLFTADNIIRNVGVDPEVDPQAAH
jgi:hypothetical protein